MGLGHFTWGVSQQLCLLAQTPTAFVDKPFEGRLIGHNLPGYSLMLHCKGLGLVLGSYKKKCMPWLPLCPGNFSGEVRATVQKRNRKLILELIFGYCLGLCGWWPLE